MRSALVATGMCAALLGSVQAHAIPVTVDGQEWLQPLAFINLSWNEVNTVCPASSGGACAGSLNGIDLTGYTWAGVDDVNRLLNGFIGSGQLGPGPDQLAEADSAWAPAFFSLFSNTEAGGDYVALNAWTSTPLNNSDAYWTRIVDFRPATASDLARTDRTRGKARSANDFGAWFYRDVATVPAPSPLALLGLGLIALGFMRRR